MLSFVIALKCRGPQCIGHAIRCALANFLAVCWIGTLLAALFVDRSFAVVKGPDGAWLRLGGRGGVLLAEIPCSSFRQQRTDAEITCIDEHERYLVDICCRSFPMIGRVATSSDQADRAQEIQGHCSDSRSP